MMKHKVILRPDLHCSPVSCAWICTVVLNLKGGFEGGAGRWTADDGRWGLDDRDFGPRTADDGSRVFLAGLTMLGKCGDAFCILCLWVVKTTPYKSPDQGDSFWGCSSLVLQAHLSHLLVNIFHFLVTALQFPPVSCMPRVPFFEGRNAHAPLSRAGMPAFRWNAHALFSAGRKVRGLVVCQAAR